VLGIVEVESSLPLKSVAFGLVFVRLRDRMDELFELGRTQPAGSVDGKSHAGQVCQLVMSDRFGQVATERSPADPSVVEAANRIAQSTSSGPSSPAAG
jgi:hypothetical protein